MLQAIDNKLFAVPAGYEVIFRSSPEKTPKIFLVGEEHDFAWRKSNAEKIFNQVIIDKSALFCESVRSCRMLPEERKIHILSDLFITDEQKERFEIVSGWDDQDIYLKPEDQDLNQQDVLMSALVAGYWGSLTKVSEIIRNLRITIQVGCSGICGYSQKSIKYEFDLYLRGYSELQDRLIAKIDSLGEETQDQLALWANKFEQCGMFFPYYSLLFEVKTELLKIKAEIEVEKIKLKDAPNRDLGEFAVRLDEIRANLLSILSIFNKAQAQVEALDQQHFSDESKRERFPARTEQMKNTLLKIEKMEIEGNIILIAGWRHLKETLCDDGSAPDQRYSLEPLYEVLKILPYPVIVLKPSQELIDNPQ